jgi:hypothetical protein
VAYTLIDDLQTAVMRLFGRPGRGAGKTDLNSSQPS